MESATAAVRGAGASLARARAAFVRGGGARGPRRVVGAGGLAARGRRRRALVAVASLHEPLPSRAQEGHVPAAPQVSPSSPRSRHGKRVPVFFSAHCDFLMVYGGSFCCRLMRRRSMGLALLRLKPRLHQLVSPRWPKWLNLF